MPEDENRPEEDAYNRNLITARQQMLAGDGPRARLLRTLHSEMAAMLVRVQGEADVGTITPQRAERLRRSIRREMRRLEERLTAALSQGAREAAELAAEGHAAGTAAAAEIAEISVAADFTSVPREALEGVMVRRGLSQGGTLSETFQTLIRRNAMAAAEDIDRAITSAVARGMSNQRLTTEIAAQLARDEPEMRRALRSLGPRGGRTLAAIDEGVEIQGPTLKRAKRLLYDARRIAVTEINTAYTEASLVAAEKSPVVSYVRWRVSSRHWGLSSSPDICSVYQATDRHGLGEGIFTPTNCPSHPHPFCMCWQSSVVRPPEEWGEPSPPAAQPKEITDEEMRRALEEAAEDERRSESSRKITDAFVKTQAKMGNRGLRRAHEGILQSVPERFRVEKMAYGPKVPEKLREKFEQYDAATYSDWVRRASETTSFSADDLSHDAVQHAAEFELPVGDQEAFLQQAISVVRNADSYRAKIWQGSEVQIEFWRGRDFAVVDRSLRIRGCYRTPVEQAAKNIKQKRLWLKTSGNS